MKSVSYYLVSTHTKREPDHSPLGQTLFLHAFIYLQILPIFPDPDVVDKAPLRFHILL